jgi:hypothetical protein
MKYMQGIAPKGAVHLLLISQWFFIFTNGVQDYLSGGNAWKQGDWLINSELVSVRRGLFGSLILHAADWLSANPLLILISVQLAFLTVLGYAMLKMMATFRVDDARVALFVLPTFLLAFWANDPEGSLRKELILFAGLALIVIGSISSKLPIVAGALISALAMFAHEVNLLMLPFVMYALYLVRQRLSKQMLITLTGLLIASFLISLHYNYTNQQVQDVSLICTPLTNRALSKDICTGAIQWLNLDAAEVRKIVVSRITTRTLVAFLLFFTMSAAVWMIVAKRLVGLRLALALFLVPLMTTAPLYFLAVDWGRWMNVSFTVSTFLLVAHTLRSKVPAVQVNWKYLYLLAMASAALSPLHTLGLSSPKSLRFILPVFFIYLVHTKFSRLHAQMLGTTPEPMPGTSDMRDNPHQDMAQPERPRRSA